MMTAIVKRMSTISISAEHSLANVIRRTPILMYLTMFVAVPAFILASVYLATAAVMLPLSLFFGWI